MLTADLVNARRRGSELVIARLDAESRSRAVAIATLLIERFREAMGLSRDELESELSSIEVGAREQRMKDGLAKLLDDRATWDLVNGLDPEKVRRDVFVSAANARRALPTGARFDRMAVLGEAARALGVDASALDRALYADLRGANVLSAVAPIAPTALVEIYEQGQAQAVLLRAVRIRIDVKCASPAAARALFRRLKFLGLLHTITPGSLGYEIVIDGPLSLFESVTKYGQKMALVLPVLEGCEAWTLTADVRWGKTRTPLTFRSSGGTDAPGVEEPPMPESIAVFARAFAGLESKWKVAPNQRVLDLPGVGLSVPDLVFTRGKEKVYFEVLGFWSRDAVFRRVELVERGLGENVLFAVSSRLRVSEEVLADDASGALYVYKAVMSARSVLDRLERLCRRSAASA